jgi:hypothetical protein
MMKQRIISVLIALLAIAGTARAVDSYGIKVCGVQLTSANYQNLGSMLLSQGVLRRGTVSFDPETATLYLQDASLVSTSSVIVTVTNAYFSRLKVKLTGDNSLSSDQTAFFLSDNSLVYIDGPGKLFLSNLTLYNNSILYVRDVGQLSLNTTNAYTGSIMAVFNSKVFFYSNIRGILSGFMTQGVRFEDSRVYFNDQQGCFYTTSTGYEASQAVLLPHATLIDFNNDGAINDSDIAMWHYKKIGLNQPGVSEVKADLNGDGLLDAADLVTFVNYRNGTLKQGWRIMYLRDKDTSSIFNMGNTQYFTYDTAEEATHTWSFLDANDATLQVDDQDASHFSCTSWNSSIAEVSVVPISLSDHLTTYGFKVTAKQTGSTTIVCFYDDGLGNTARVEVPISCYKRSEVLSSGDRLFAVEEGDDGLKNNALNTNMNVPVGTTMMLSIDHQLENGYSLDDRRKLIAATKWKVSGNDKVTLTKTNNGYVEVKVEGAGPFTVTSTDCNNVSRSATFKARDVYMYDEHEVYKNGEAYLFKPQAKTSETMGEANHVSIKKMVTHNGDVWTVINHYRRLGGSSPLGDCELGYNAPVYAQVFRNTDLYYESEDTYLEDIALYDNHAMAVGWKYDPSLDFGDTGAYLYACIPDFSFRKSAFFVHLDINTHEATEHFNPFGHDRESALEKVVYNEGNGEVSMLGYAARRRKALALFEYDYAYPHDWAYLRWNSDATVLKGAQKRKDNDNYSYKHFKLAVANNKVVGLMDVMKYSVVDEGLEIVSFCSEYIHTKLFYDFNDFEDGGSVDLFENNNYNFGFTSASYNSNLYMWIKNEVVCFSNDFLSSYPIPYSLSNGREISKLKVVKNGVQPEEFFTFCYVKDSSGKRIYFSSIFGFMEVPSTCVGFDLMMY